MLIIFTVEEIDSDTLSVKTKHRNFEHLNVEKIYPKDLYNTMAHISKQVCENSDYGVAFEAG